MNKTILLSALLVAAGTVHAQASSRSSNETRLPQQRVYTYAIELDAAGKVGRLAPHGFVADAISGRLDGEVRDWIFEPAAAPDAAVPSTTFLRIVVAPHGDGAADDFEVVSAMTGPAPERLTQPDYPLHDQRVGREGSLVLKLEVGADGRVQSVEIHDLLGDISRKMAQGAKSSALDWRFTPETVAGKPLASTILWPVCFLGATSSTANCTWVGPDSQRFSSKTVLTLNPAARLVYPLASGGR